MKRSIGILLACVALSACTTVPTGQKNGTITKLAQSGFFNPTWEGEIVRGGSFTGGTGVQGASFDFTVSDPVMLKQVQDAFDHQREVRITYHKVFPAFWSSDSDGYFLDKIEIVSAADGGTLSRNGQGDLDQQPVAQPTDPVNSTADSRNTDNRFTLLLQQNQEILKQNQQLLDKLTK